MLDTAKQKTKILLILARIFIFGSIFFCLLETTKTVLAFDGIINGSEYVFDSCPARLGVSIAALDSSHFVAIRTDSEPYSSCPLYNADPWHYPAYAPKAVIGTVLGTNISYGQSYAFEGFNEIMVTVLDSTHFVVAGRTGKAQIGTVSGNSISFGPTFQFDSEIMEPSIAILDNTHFIITYTTLQSRSTANACGAYADYYGKAVAGTVSGNSISFTQPYAYVSPCSVFENSAVVIDSTHFVVTYAYGGGKARVGTISANAISYGPELTFDDYALESWSARLSSNKFVVAFWALRYDRYGYLKSSGRVRIGTISGNNISFGPDTPFAYYPSVDVGTSHISVSALDSNRFVIAYRDENDNALGKNTVGTVSGNVAYFGPPAVFNNGATAGGSGHSYEYGIVVSALSNSKFVVTYYDGGNSNYSTVVAGTTFPVNPPSVITNPATDIKYPSMMGSYYQATFNGEITYLDGYSFAEAWFQYGTTIAYGTDIANFVQKTTGPFSVLLVTLLPATTYHYRAVIRNTAGTFYGNDQSFTTGAAPPVVTTNAATNIQSSQATLNGNLSSLGSTSSCNVWFQWGTTTAYGNETAHTIKNATGVFGANITGLSPGTTYYFRAVAENSGGIVYGTNRSFATSVISPSVATNAATNIQQVQTTLNGNLTNLGGASSCNVWFQWGTTTAYGNQTVQAAKNTMGTFNANLTGLNPGTTYYFRTVAQNGAGTSYGGNQSFTTTFNFPAISTDPATNIQFNQATLNGNLTNLGGASSCNVWFQWGASTSYGNETSHVAKSSTGIFNNTISGLNSGTAYCFRAVAENPGGVVYGLNTSFTTIILPVPPEARNLSVTQSDYCEASHPPVFLSWEFYDAGGRTQDQYQVQIDTDQNFGSPEIDSCNPSPGTCSPGHASTSFAPTNLSYDTIYYWRVKVWNTLGAESNWSIVLGFTTEKCHPTCDFTWSPQPSILGKPTQFTDQSVACGGANIVLWSWTFENGSPSASSEQSPTVTFDRSESENKNEVNLVVTDSNGNSCQTKKNIKTTLPLPEWREIRSF